MTEPRIKCRQARNDAALSAGGDLDEDSTLRLERHLAVCPECRRFRDDLFSAQRVLHAAADGPREKSSKPPRSRRAAPRADDPESEWWSLWSGISAQLDARDRAMRAPRFNGWAPFVAVAAACALIAVLTSRHDNVSDRPSHLEALPVGTMPAYAFPPYEAVEPDEEAPRVRENPRDRGELELIRPQETLFQLVPFPQRRPGRH